MLFFAGLKKDFPSQSYLFEYLCQKKYYVFRMQRYPRVSNRYLNCTVVMSTSKTSVYYPRCFIRRTPMQNTSVGISDQNMASIGVNLAYAIEGNS